MNGTAEPIRNSEITRLLWEWSDGAPEAFDELLPLVFDELREIARRSLAGESQCHTLQPTALVHEVYLELVGRRSVRWRNRDQFFGSMAGLMRRILVDHARTRRAAKRGGDAVRLPLDEALALGTTPQPDLVALDDALRSLAAVDERRCRIVELKFFTGLTDREVAGVLDISVNTVRRQWQGARAWLHGEISPDAG